MATYQLSSLMKQEEPKVFWFSSKHFDDIALLKGSVPQ